MYCTKCGNYLFDDHQYCMNCGTERPVPPPSKKGTVWVPVSLTVLMLIFGCAVYYFSLYGNPFA